jgi:hypothetical protein
MSVRWSFHPLFILPLPAVAQWVRCFVTAPRAGHTQTLTRGPRSRAFVSAGIRSNSPRKTAAQKQIAQHIPYVWRSVGSRIAGTIASTPTTFVVWHPVSSRSWS